MSGSLIPFNAACPGGFLEWKENLHVSAPIEFVKFSF